MDCELYKAAREGNVEYLTKTHIRHTEEGDGGGGGGADENYFLSRTPGENSIIHVAARPGHEHFVQEALHLFPILLCQTNSRDDIPLHVAARFGHVRLVELLASSYVSSTPDQQEVGASTINGSISMSPIRDGDIEEGVAAQQLPPPWRMKNSEGSMPLHDALRNGHGKVAQYLLELDHELACFVNDAGESPLYLAAESRCEEVFRNILNTGFPYSLAGPQGQNPLHAARHSAKSIRLLLRKRPELIKQADDCGKTALHYAVEARSLWLLRLLLKIDASAAFLRDADGYTPLLRASRIGWRPAVQAIIDHCPQSIEICARNGRNALHLMKMDRYAVAKKILKIPEVRELINERDDEGNTPMHLAVKNHNNVMALVLLESKAVDLRAKTKEGLTALDICESEWELSYKQRRMRSRLISLNAPRGRHPEPWRVLPIRSRDTYVYPKTDLKQMANTLSVVATLLATVTFAAAFTLPGGYYNNGDGKNLGAAILIKKAALQAFVLSDTFAMCCSMTVVFLLIWAMVGEPDLFFVLIKVSRELLKLALYGTLVAFITGLYAVTAQESLWVAVLICIMGSIVPLVVSRRMLWGFASGLWAVRMQPVVATG